MKSFFTKLGTELQLLNMKGKDYLEVKYRIQWFREEKPDWSIETELVEKENACLAKATIKDPSGRVISTSHKYEDAKGFPDFREKSETGAIGRALALIGYGTQFCAEELDEGKRIVDAPVGKPNPHAAGAWQPDPNDGIQIPHPDKILKGKWAGYRLPEIPIEEQRSYVNYFDDCVAKGKLIPEWLPEIIEKMENYIGLMENQTTTSE